MCVCVSGERVTAFVCAQLSLLILGVSGPQSVSTTIRSHQRPGACWRNVWLTPYLEGALIQLRAGLETDRWRRREDNKSVNTALKILFLLMFAETGTMKRETQKQGRKRGTVGILAVL